MPTWNHDGDPVPNLMVNSRVDEFKVGDSINGCVVNVAEQWTMYVLHMY